jgi:hypothetical protein
MPRFPVVLVQAMPEKRGIASVRPGPWLPGWGHRICDGATGAGTHPHWTTDDLSKVIGVRTIGTSCAGFRPYAMAISPDDYLVACFPADAGTGQLAGPGSTWKVYHP